MFNKLLFLLFLAFLIGKWFVLPRLHVWKAKLDRVVNATLIAIALVYTARLFLWLY